LTIFCAISPNAAGWSEAYPEPRTWGEVEEVSVFTRISGLNRSVHIEANSASINQVFRSDLIIDLSDGIYQTLGIQRAGR
jgi:hypothetical protein